MDLPRVVERARALMSELMNVHVTAAAVGKTGSDENKHMENSSRANGRQERAGQTDKRSCYGCGGPTSCATVLTSVLGRKSVGPVVDLVIYPQCAPETRDTHTGEPLRRRFLERNKGASSC